MAKNNNRDDFTSKTIQILGKRVNFICSNPECRRGTMAASSDSENFTNTGVAAHICAAAPGGPRYDPKMTHEERKSINNGIWLCQTCSKLIDSDELKYTVEKLKQWKLVAENRACLGLVKPIYEITENDKKIMDIIPTEPPLHEVEQNEDEYVYSELYKDYIQKFDMLKDYLYCSNFGNFFNKDYNNIKNNLSLVFGKKILNWLIGKEKFPTKDLMSFYEDLSMEYKLTDNSLLKKRWEAVKLYFDGDIEKSQKIYFELFDIIEECNDIPSWFKDDICIDGRNIINLIDNINGKYSINNIFQQLINKNKHKLSYPGLDRIRCDVYERSIERVIEYKNKYSNTIMFGIGLENLFNLIQEAVYISVLYGSITQLRLVRNIFSNIMALSSDNFDDIKFYKLTLKLKVLAGKFDDFKKIYNNIKYKYDFVNDEKFICEVINLKDSLLSFDLNYFYCFMFELYGRNIDDGTFLFIENKIYEIIDDTKQINPNFIDKALKALPNNMLRLKNKALLFEILLNYVSKGYSRFYIYFGNILNNVKLNDLSENEKEAFIKLINNCYNLENVNVVNAVIEIKNIMKTEKYDLYLYQSDVTKKIVSYINDERNIDALKEIINEITIRVNRREKNPAEHIEYGNNYNIINFFSKESYDSNLKQIVINDIIPLAEKILSSSNQYANEKINILKTIFNILNIDGSKEILNSFKIILDKVNLKSVEEPFNIRKNSDDIKVNVLLLKYSIGELKFKELISNYLMLIGKSDDNLIEILQCLDQLIKNKRISHTNISYIYIIYNYAINKRNILFTRYAIQLTYIFVNTEFFSKVEKDLKKIISYNNYDEMYYIVEMVYNLKNKTKKYFNEIIMAMNESTNYNIKYVINKYCKI